MKRDRNTPGNHVGFNEVFRAMFARSKTDEVEVRNPTLPEPSNKKIALGFSPEGDVVMMPAWARNILIAGDEGRRRTGERILSEIVRIPKKNRELVIIDLGGGELSRWAKCANAYASDIVEADCALSYTVEQAEQRVEERIEQEVERWNAGDFYFNEHPWEVPNHKQTFVYVNDLSDFFHLLSGEDEEHRKHALRLIHELSFRNFEFHMTLVAETIDIAALGENILLRRFNNRIIGHVDSPMVATKACGFKACGFDIREWGYDLTRLADNWVIALFESSGVRSVRVPDDFDPDAVSSDPRYFVPENERIPIYEEDWRDDE